MGAGIAMGSLHYKKHEAGEITPAFFQGFDRYQKVSRCWRKEGGVWTLKDIAFVEEWGQEDFAYLAQALSRTLAQGGILLEAREDDGALAGFAALDGEPFGSAGQYLNLSNLHVSFGHRGRGIGKALFSMICKQARARRAGKLYISAHSSKESQAFYRAVGCREALETNQKLAEAEPCDCQLEFVLTP